MKYTVRKGEEEKKTGWFGLCVVCVISIGFVCAGIATLMQTLREHRVSFSRLLRVKLKGIVGNKYML